MCSALLSESLQQRVHLDLISLLQVLHRVRRGLCTFILVLYHCNCQVSSMWHYEKQYFIANVLKYSDCHELNITLRTENCQVMVLAAAKFYFQQQLTVGAACSGASKTFALGDQRCFTNIRTWQFALLHKQSHLSHFKLPVRVKHLLTHATAVYINTYSEMFSLTQNIMMQRF